MDTFTAKDRYSNEYLDISYDGQEGNGLWFGVRDEDLALGSEDSQRFIDWIYANFKPSWPRIGDRVVYTTDRYDTTALRHGTGTITEILGNSGYRLTVNDVDVPITNHNWFYEASEVTPL